MSEAVVAGAPEALRREFVAWLDMKARLAEIRAKESMDYDTITYAEGEAAAYREATDHWRAVRIEGGQPRPRDAAPLAKLGQDDSGRWHWVSGETLACDWDFATEADARADAEASGYEVVA